MDVRPAFARLREGRGVGAFLALIVGLALAAAPAEAQRVVTCPAPAGIVDAVGQPMAAVRYLSDDRLEGRLSGADGERCTAEYIAVEFARIGLRPGGSGGGYLQAVELASVVNPHAPPGVGYNVVGVLEGSDPALRGEAVVLGAHHDHLGRGEFFGSMAGADVPPNQIHNGADDNASGVGALLAAAEALARRPPARTVVFVTFSGEESGLLGSARFVQNSPIPAERTEAMLNLDMVGRLGAGPLIVNGTGTAAEWNEILDRLEGEYGIETARSPEGFGPSDHTSFYAREIPVLHFFTNVHGEYHHPNDDWPLVDATGLARIAALVEGTIRAVADRPGGLTYLAGAGAPAPMVSTGNRAYFGSIPDFAPVPFGVRFSGVTAGSPAADAGLRAGDILIRLGDYEVRDLYVMTEALDQLRAGTRVDATVLRDGQPITVSVLLRERPGN